MEVRGSMSGALHLRRQLGNHHTSAGSPRDPQSWAERARGLGGCRKASLCPLCHVSLGLELPRWGPTLTPRRRAVISIIRNSLLIKLDSLEICIHPFDYSFFIECCFATFSLEVKRHCDFNPSILRYQRSHDHSKLTTRE